MESCEEFPFADWVHREGSQNRETEIEYAARERRCSGFIDWRPSPREAELVDLRRVAEVSSRIESDGFLPPLNVIISGPRVSGKRWLARAYSDALRKSSRFSSMVFLELDGAEISLAQLHKAKGNFVYVDNLRGFMENSQFLPIVDFLRSSFCRVVVAFGGGTDEADRLLRKAPKLAPRIVQRIDLKPFTTRELAQIFHSKLAGHFLLLPPILERVEKIIEERGLGVIDVEAWCGRALYAGYARVRREKNQGQDELDLMGYEEIEATAPRGGSFGGAKSELSELVGLTAVKEQISAEIAQQQACNMRERLGLKSPRVSRHMVFDGNPGTGKTEMARLVARIYREEGILAEGNLFEVGRQDLVGQHIGETAQKVHSLFESARGSVIFIDEAYSLIPSSDRDFSHEALNTLVADMENFRDDVVVILAGYTNLMDRLLAVNPGFASRIQTRITFPDYTVSEMLEILQRMAAINDFILGAGVREKMSAVLARESASPGFGNARSVRSHFERALKTQASRLMAEQSEVNESALKVLTEEDFTGTFASLQTVQHRLGFQFRQAG